VPQRLALARVLSSGMAALIVAMGVGRFAYTPLLPLMQHEFGFSAAMAGGLAALNFAGYLLGALLFVLLPISRHRVRLLQICLALSVGTTAAMGLSTTPVGWGALRLLAGIASAGVYVLASALVLEALAAHASAWLSGLFYSGVGLGIVLTGLLVMRWEQTLASGAIWLGLAVVCVPLAYYGAQGLPVPLAAQPQTATPIHPGGRWLLGGLILAYFCEGLGYIITGTFLVTIVRSATTISGNGVWITVGLAATVITPLWPIIVNRIGAVPALVTAHLLQAVGILLPAVSARPWAAVFGAILFGATFMGIAVMSLNLGRSLVPQRSLAVIGLLTAAFGTGQVLGPLLAGVLATRTASFTLALVIAAAVVALGALALLVGSAGSRTSKEDRCPTSISRLPARARRPSRRPS
jgi:MFS family permease